MYGLTKNNARFYAWFILTIVCLLLSFRFELNGAVVFFGIDSVYNYIVVVTALGKIFFGFFFRDGSKYYVLIFTFATMMFASLDTVTHYRNSIGHDELVRFKVTENDRQLKSYHNELQRIENNEQNVNRNYGSMTRRELALQELLDRKDFLNKEVKFLNNEKIKLLDITRFDVVVSIVKLICLIILELLVLACIRFKPERDLMKPSNISHGDVDIIKKVISNKTTKVDMKYPFRKKYNEELFLLLVKFGLVFKYKNEYYTYSKEIADLQRS